MALETIFQLIAWQPKQEDYIIEGGILVPETRMIIFGPPKSWKSMLAMHTGFVLANGESWFGHKTTKCFPIIIQVELPKAVYRKRAIKYAEGHKLPYPRNLLFESATRLKIDTRYGREQLEAHIKTTKEQAGELHVVIILDPIYKLMSGHISDEYDTKQLLDNLDELKDKHHVSYVLIHHTHKTRFDAQGNIIDLGPEESMGSSYFGNWADTMVRVRLLDQSTTQHHTEMSFDLVRHAEDLLHPFRVEWSRETLQPRVTKRIQLDIEDITVRAEEIA